MFLVFHARHMLQDGGMIKKTKKVSGPFVQLSNYIAVLGPLCIILLVAEKNSVKKSEKVSFLFFFRPIAPVTLNGGFRMPSWYVNDRVLVIVMMS